VKLGNAKKGRACHVVLFGRFSPVVTQIKTSLFIKKEYKNKMVFLLFKTDLQWLSNFNSQKTTKGKIKMHYLIEINSYLEGAAIIECLEEKSIPEINFLFTLDIENQDGVNSAIDDVKDQMETIVEQDEANWIYENHRRE